jgi:hypothetical protein
MLIIVARYNNRIDLLRSQDDIQRSDAAPTGDPRYWLSADLRLRSQCRLIDFRQ